MYNVNSELLIYANTVCLEAYVSLFQASDSDSNFATYFLWLATVNIAH